MEISRESIKNEYVACGRIKLFRFIGRAVLHHLGVQMKGAGSPKLLFENLDITPIQPTLWTGLHEDGPGRPVEYQPEWDLKALMLRQLLQIPYMKDLVKRLKRNPHLRHACGYHDKTSTEAHFIQMKKRIGVEGSLSASKISA